MAPDLSLVSRLIAACTAGALALLPTMPAAAQAIDPALTDLPVLSPEVGSGAGTTTIGEPLAPTPKTIDGDPSDWIGTPTRYGGTVVYSAGELVYQDHLFDAHGPDDGRDASRLDKTDQITAVAPEAYRLDALAQADAAGELGIPTPEEYSYNDSYGDATSHQDAADLHEARVAVDADSLDLLARTTSMSAANQTGVLLLVDVDGSSGPARDVPFNAGITSEAADYAVYLAADGASVIDLASGASAALPGGSVAVQPAGYTNAIEASVPLALLGNPGSLRIALATGRAGDAGFAPLDIEMNNETPHANLANVAFRTSEPVRVWFEHDQALALHAGSIDDFFVNVDTSKLSAGVTETYRPGPGYHDRIFISAESVANESGRNGIFQHYGLFLPTDYRAGEALPLQWWLHWRGGNAHTAAGVAPRIFEHFGNDQDTIVVSPSGRGTGRWYVGKGHVDFLEVWADVFDSFAIDRERVYVTGHSMGGWGSYLLTLLYPDRFAAAAPYAGPVTQGAWTGADFEGCDEMTFDEYSPCYISANGSNPRDQHTRKILENSLHVPYAIMHGTSDELVPYSGVARQAERLFELGHRFRFYTYPGYEHYSHPIMDQWSEAARYMHAFTRPLNPAHVTYKRDMPFEVATETVQSDGLNLNFDFDSAYWMSELTATDQARGTAFFDGRSLALDDPAHLTAPDTGPPTSPGTTGPYVITGLQWVSDPTATPAERENGFEATLEGASKVRVDLARMGIDAAKTSFGRVTTDGPLTLRVDGGWTTLPAVTVNGEPAAGQIDNGVLTVALPGGSSLVTITPQDDPVEAPPVVAFTDGSARSGQYSDDVPVEALLVDGAGAPLANADVTFELAGAEGSRTWTATTDDSGVAASILTLAEAPGTYTLTVSYADATGSTTDTVDFEIVKEDTNLTLSTQGKGSKTTWVATLTDADSGAGIAGRTIEFYADDTQLGTATTGSDGTATFTPPARNRNSTGEARFSEDDYYKGSSGS